MIVANGVGIDSAEGTQGAAAGTGGFEVAGCVLVVLEMLILLLNCEGVDKIRGSKERERCGKERRLTAGQQPPPQQDSPATQNVSPQHVDPFGGQKGATLEEEAMQHWSNSSDQQIVLATTPRSTPHHQG